MSSFGAWAGAESVWPNHEQLFRTAPWPGVFVSDECKEQRRRSYTIESCFSCDLLLVTVGVAAHHYSYSVPQKSSDVLRMQETSQQGAKDILQLKKKTLFLCTW